MYKNRVNVEVTYPEGKVKNFRAYCAWVGPNRVTWCNAAGLRSYVLLRHGFVVKVTNL